jgi:hypothetical protein
MVVSIGILASGALLVGSGWWRDDRSVLTSSPLPASSSPRSMPSIAPESTLQPTARPTPDPIVVRLELGFWYSAAQRYAPVSWAGPGAFGQGCPAETDFCAAMVRVRVGSVEEGVVLRGGDEGVALSGSSLNEVERSWTAAYGATTFEEVTIDGIPARLASTNSREPGEFGAFALYADRLFAIEAYSLLGYGPVVAREFIADFHFLTAGCWMLPCEAEPGPWRDPTPAIEFVPSDAGGTWSSEHGWHGGPPPPDRTARGFWYGRCADNLCAGYVNVSIGTAATGAIVDFDVQTGRTIRVAGLDIEALGDAWVAQFGPTTTERIEVDGEAGLRITMPGQQTILLPHRGRVIAITAFGGFSGAGNVAEVMDGFLAGISLL